MRAPVLDRLLSRLLPYIPKALLEPFAAPYVAGECLEDMIEVVTELNRMGMLATVDLLGEFIHDTHRAYDTIAAYRQILEAIQVHQLEANISVKLTALGLLLDPALCLDLMQELAKDAGRRNNFIRIDMEDSHCTQATLDLYLQLRKTHDNVGIVLQAYLRRTYDDALRIIASGDGHFRLCKGIYLEPRRLAYPLPDVINANYLDILELMFEKDAYVGIATHDERLVWGALQRIRRYGIPKDRYEFQMLLGVDTELRDMLVAEGHRVRIYVPFGREWQAYCLRRLKENPKIVGYVLKNLIASLRYAELSR